MAASSALQLFEDSNSYHTFSRKSPPWDLLDSSKNPSIWWLFDKINVYNLVTQSIPWRKLFVFRQVNFFWNRKHRGLRRWYRKKKTNGLRNRPGRLALYGVCWGGSGDEPSSNMQQAQMSRSTTCKLYRILCKGLPLEIWGSFNGLLQPRGHLLLWWQFLIAVLLQSGCGFWLPQILGLSTLPNPKTNIATENRVSQKEIHLPTTILQVQTVGFREGMPSWQVVYPIIYRF